MRNDSRPLRIAFGRIQQETNAFSPVPSTMDDFRRLHWLEGPALLAACGRWRSEVPGLIRNAELSGFVRAARRAGGGGVEPVPLFSAWAMPSGPLAEGAYRELGERLRRSLREALPLDGVFLALHGAMRASGTEPEPEEGFLAAVGEVVGPEVPIAATFDLHGQMTPGKVGPLDVLAAYRTNPHRDLARTGYRAGELLVRTLRGEVRPTSAWRSLPMVLGGGTTIDFLEPMRGVFRRMRQMERDPRVLCASLFTCHVWNDSPDLGWSVHVATDGDPALADRLADELADRAWEVRRVPPPAFATPEEAIAEVRRARVARWFGTVCVADVSDAVGAGAPGDSTHILRALLERGGDLRAYLPLRDPDAVERLWKEPEGTAVRLSVGGRIDPATSPPLDVAGTLLARKETRYFGRAAVLALGGVRLVLTELPPYNVRPSFFTDLGLSPWRADLVVVKGLFHFRLFYALVNRRTIAVRTPGFTDLDLYRRVPFRDAVHPRDEVADWRPADGRRRGLIPAPA